MKKRIVVKVGSNVLTRKDGKLDITRMSALVDQMAQLHRAGHELILVSSGAVACGRGLLNVSRRLDTVEQRQLFSSIGQVKLINLYYDLFREYHIPVGQLLTMKESFATRREYLNQRACMDVMLQNGVIPVVNENDTVSVTELMFTDNDELSGLIASMMDADLLIILSNIDGIYDGMPGAEGSRLIERIAPNDDATQYVQAVKSGFGRGGMRTKCGIARRVADEGIAVMIANGRREEVLTTLVEQPSKMPHTLFVPAAQPVSGVKKWIAHSGSFTKGIAYVNDQAAKALLSERVTSLLLVGVTRIEGEFEEGDIIAIHDSHDTLIAIGRSAYDSESARKLAGAHAQRPLVHYDYLYIE